MRKEDGAVKDIGEMSFIQSTKTDRPSVSLFM
jgi:hypothetical protein